MGGGWGAAIKSHIFINIQTFLPKCMIKKLTHFFMHRKDFFRSGSTFTPPSIKMLLVLKVLMPFYHDFVLFPEIKNLVTFL